MTLPERTVRYRPSTSHWCERCEAFTREPCALHVRPFARALTSSEAAGEPDDATLLAAIADALEDETSGFYVWAPGTPLLLTRD